MPGIPVYPELDDFVSPVSAVEPCSYAHREDEEAGEYYG